MPIYAELKDLGVFPVYVLAICSILAFLYQHLRESQSRRFKITKGEFDALVEVFRDSKLKNSPFILEQVIQLKLKRLIPYQVIKILLRFDNPTGAMLDFWNAQRVLEVPPNKNYLAYIKKFSSPSKRKWRKWSRGTVYWIGALFGSLLMSMDIGALGKADALDVLVLAAASLPLIIASFCIAYEGLNSYIGVVCAERLMQEAAVNGFADPALELLISDRSSAFAPARAKARKGGRTRRSTTAKAR